MLQSLLGTFQNRYSIMDRAGDEVLFIRAIVSFKAGIKFQGRLVAAVVVVAKAKLQIKAKVMMTLSFS